MKAVIPDGFSNLNRHCKIVVYHATKRLCCREVRIHLELVFNVLEPSMTKFCHGCLNVVMLGSMTSMLCSEKEEDKLKTRSAENNNRIVELQDCMLPHAEISLSY